MKVEALVKFTAVLALAAAKSAMADCLQTDIDALSKADAAQTQCMNISDVDMRNDITTFDRCFERFTRNLAYEACSQAIRTTSKIQNFLWQQKVANTQDLRDGRIDQNRWRENSQRLIGLIVEEQKEGKKEMQLEREARKSAYDQAVANVRINRAISIFGQLNENRARDRFPSPENYSFIMNGRIVNCTEFSNIINCR